MANHARKIAKHSVVYGLGGVIGKAIGFIMIPVYTRYLTPADYGIYALLILTTQILTMFLTLGLSSATLRYYFEYDEEAIQKKVISTALIVSIAISFFGAGTANLFRSQLSMLCFDSPQYAQLFTYVLFAMAFEISMEVPLAFIRAKDLSHIFLIVETSRLAVALALNILFVVYYRMGLSGILISNLITSIVFGAGIIFFTFAKTTFAFSKKLFSQLLSYGWPLIFSGFGFFVIQSSDKFFLKHYSTFEQLGLFSLSERFVSIFPLLIIGPFWKMYGPYRFAIMNRDDAKSVYAAVQKMMFAICAIVGLTLAILSEDVIKIVATPAFYDAYKPIPFLVLANIGRLAYYLFQTGIYLQKKTKIIPKMVWTIAVIDILANFILIPAFGIIGAAQARFGAFFSLAVLTYFISRKIYHIKYDHKANLIIVVISSAAWIISNLIAVDGVWSNIAIKSLLIFSAGLLLIKFIVGSPRQLLKKFQTA